MPFGAGSLGTLCVTISRVRRKGQRTRSGNCYSTKRPRPRGGCKIFQPGPLGVQF
jgi:hypothetical protein